METLTQKRLGTAETCFYTVEMFQVLPAGGSAAAVWADARLPGPHGSGGNTSWRGLSQLLSAAVARL